MKAPAVVRNKSIGTKVSEEEYRQLEAQANGDSLGAWVRQVLLRATEPSPAEQALMAELVALRTILLNVMFRRPGGQPELRDLFCGREQAGVNCWRYAETKPMCVTGRSLPHHPAGSGSVPDVPDGTRPSDLSSTIKGKLRGGGSKAADVVSDEQPRSSGGIARAGGFAKRAVSASPWAVCPVFQCLCGAKRAPLAKSVFRLRVGSQPSLGGTLLCRAQSGARGDGGA